MRKSSAPQKYMSTTATATATPAASQTTKKLVDGLSSAEYQARRRDRIRASTGMPKLKRASEIPSSVAHAIVEMRDVEKRSFSAIAMAVGLSPYLTKKIYHSRSMPSVLD